MGLSLKNNWLSAFQEKKFRLSFFITLIVFIAILILLTTFLDYNETIKGFSFNDPFLTEFKPINLTWFIFILIYSSLITILIHLAKHPKALVIAFQSYALLALIRIIVMYSLPLNPPGDMIPLKDPLIELFGNGKVLTKDLFFSGHTSIMFLFFLVAQSKKLKIIFLSGTLLVGAALLFQHVHYSVDVISAPVFSYSAYRIIILINGKIGLANKPNFQK